jgi:hypothetical protein
VKSGLRTGSRAVSYRRENDSLYLEYNLSEAAADRRGNGRACRRRARKSPAGEGGAKSMWDGRSRLLPLTGSAHRSDCTAATRLTGKHVRAVTQDENFPVLSGKSSRPHSMTKEQVAVLASQAVANDADFSTATTKPGSDLMARLSLDVRFYCWPCTSRRTAEAVRICGNTTGGFLSPFAAGRG